LQEEDLVLHNGVPSKVKLLKFHTPVLWPALRVVTKQSPPALELPQYPCQEDLTGDVHLSLHVFKRLRASNPLSYWRALVRVIGSLDTFDLFDLFDSDGTERPKKPLDYVVLSIPPVLVRDLPWTRVQSRDGRA
jgi:hypothetical protein